MASTESLLINGKIFQTSGVTGKDQQATFASSLLIGTDGTIRHISFESEDEVTQKARANGAKVHDLQGKTVLPGFFDGHLHLLLLGLSLKKVDLAPCKDLADIRRTIKAYALANPSLPRIMCKSWMHSMTPDGVNHSMLDDLDPRPIYVDTKDLHGTWCNQAAIDEMDKELGIGTMSSPQGGTIHRDGGKLTGLFEEAVVFTIIWPYIARISSLEERAAAMEEAIETYNAAGYVGLIDMAMNQDSWDSLLSLKARRPDLPMRIAAYWLIRPADEEDCLKQVDYVVEMASRYNATTSPDLKIVGIKIVCDGIVDACTAALSEPYTHNSSTEEPVWTKLMLLPVVRKADQAGLQVALHAIGDLAIHNAIDTIEECATPERRPRIEHLELTSAEDAVRLGKLGITASVQAVHSDPAILRAWPRLVGEHRCGRAFAYREMADGGAPIALGTDAPTAPQSLPANCYVATTRRSAREPDLQTVVNGHFALGLCESVVAGTEGSARSCFMDDVTGRLEKGMKADLAVVDMVWDKHELLKAEVTQTWFGGQQVFDVGKM
ncbi:Putative amidohydrolase YtcJ [Cytospora mali]|uniref:Amidohydrolase YtcJ n=1 Tax=Cytospora mali TaxID=578113 RepID=A0A194V7E3_CYTMA|nr:Putative amidohydrolase YtcJ [Valsa mali var. pyri (nom. inval.)]